MGSGKYFLLEGRKFRVDSVSSPSRLDDVFDSTGYICLTRLGEAVDSTQKTHRVDSKNCSSKDVCLPMAKINVPIVATKGNATTACTTVAALPYYELPIINTPFFRQKISFA